LPSRPQDGGVALTSERTP